MAPVTAAAVDAFRNVRRLGVESDMIISWAGVAKAGIEAINISVGKDGDKR
jgi:hypothetical protein